MNRNKLISWISASIHKVDPEAVVYLYGSRARGENNKDSDRDVLILVNESKITNEIEDKFRDELFNIELNQGQIISTLIYPKQYWYDTLSRTPLFKNVSKEGIVII